MNSLVRTILGTTLVTTTMLAAFTPAFAVVDSSPGTAIVKIEGESDKAVSIVTVALSGRPDWSKEENGSNPVVEDHGTFIQVLLPQTVVPSPGNFLDAHSPFITKIAAFQVPNAKSGQPTDAAVRLFLNRDAAIVRKATFAEILADRLVVTLDHKKLDAAIAASGQIMSPASRETPEAGATAESKEPGQPLAPADLVKAEVAQGTDPIEEPASSDSRERSTSANSGWTRVGAKVPDLSGKLAIASGFSLFMLALLGIVYKWRRINPFNPKFEDTGAVRAPSTSRFKNIIKHRVPQSEDGDDFARDTVRMTMKTISTMHVGPRQKLALVQVGSETVLLSISPTGIQFLTNVGSQSNRPQPVQMMQMATAPMQQISAPSPKSFEERVAERDADQLEEVQTSRPRVKPASRQGATTAKKVRVAITDSGISNLETGAEAATESRPAGKASEKPSDDITRLIREKLRNLPVI
ncbi:hypothetical protein EBZ80_04610 [bacterium]|nr:hypothetical protein [bacterium]